MLQKVFIPLLVILFCNIHAFAQLDVRISNGDVLICAGDSIYLESNVIVGSPIKYSWNCNTALFSDINAANTWAKFTGSAPLILKTEDGSNINYDTVIITYRLKPNVQMADKAFCESMDTIQLIKDKVLLIPGNPALGRQKWNCLDSGGQSWSQIFKNKFPDISGYPQDYFIAMNTGAFAFGSQTEVKLRVELVFTDAFGCVNKDTSELHLYKSIIPIIDRNPFRLGNTFPPFLFCENQDPIVLKSNTTGGTWQCKEPNVVVKDTFYAEKAPYDKRFFIHFDYNPAPGCSGKDSVEVVTEALPILQIKPSDTLIYEDKTISVTIKADTTNTKGITWFPFGRGKIDYSNKEFVTFTVNVDTLACDSFYLYCQTVPGNACPFVDDLFTLYTCPKKMNPLGLEEMLVGDFNVFPNPSKGTFQITNTQNLKFELVDLLGRKVELHSLDKNMFETNVKGTFFLIGENDDEQIQVIQRILIQ